MLSPQSAISIYVTVNTKSVQDCWMYFPGSPVTVLSPRLVVPSARLWPRFGKYSRFELQLNST